MKREKSKTAVILAAMIFSFGAQAQQLELWNTFQSAGEPSDLGGTRIAIGAYNLENLFDTVHDEGKNDYARMPLAWKRAHPDVMNKACASEPNPYYKKECYELDWNDDVLRAKLDNLGKSIRSMNQGHGPDILVVEEVENIKVLTQLRDQALADMGYQTVLLIEGPDKRGIDVGMLSRFPVVDAQLHVVDLNSPVPQPVALSAEEAATMRWDNGVDTQSEFSLQSVTSGHVTRGVLEATFKIGNRNLTVFGNHWPSQAGPTEQRARAAWTLYQAASKAYDLKRDVVALGDFNTLETDKPNPFAEYLMNPRSPLQFMDARDEFLRRVGPDHIAQGTHNYQGKWSFLDRFFVLKQSTGARMENEWQNFTVNAPDFVLTNARSRSNTKDSGFDLFGDIINEGMKGTLIPAGKIPMRFDPETKTGYSDHLSIMGTMNF